MKRALSTPPTVVAAAAVSQFDVAGGEQACTAIAVVACAGRLAGHPATPERLALYVHQGAALYGVWKKQQQQQHTYAHAKEVVDLVSAAWPICAGREYGGALWTWSATEATPALDQALLLQAAHEADAQQVAVLTCGAYSVALLSATELFDSHEREPGATLVQFESHAALLDHLRERFPDAAMPYSLCMVERRTQPRAPCTFPKQDAAFAAADSLPPGFHHVWARDRNDTGSKEYLVAGVEDFFLHYSALDAADRVHYDIARTGRPVDLYVDLEFYVQHNPGRDRRAMLDAFLELVRAEHPAADGDFDVYDSGNSERVSYHVHHHGMAFANTDALGALMRRVDQRAPDELRVWRPVWDCSTKTHVLQRLFFADMSVYTANRCFRLCYSTKFGGQRPFRPLLLGGGTVEREPFVRSLLVMTPSPAHYALPSAEPQQEPQQQQQQQRSTTTTTTTTTSLRPMSELPAPLADVARAVEQHYRPQRMRGFQVAPLGLLTFSMIKHDCEICNDTHNNQVYVVVDLKLRAMYAKCHAQRKKTGAAVPFPDWVGPLSLVREEELAEDKCTFPAPSSAAHLILGLARAVYDGARSAPPIPEPGSAVVRYERATQRHVVPLRHACALDGGGQELEVALTGMTIRCRGPRCTTKGKRWERPSRSSLAAGSWHLSFLFPVHAAAADTELEVVAAAAGAVAGPCTLEHFLAEPNFFRALGIEDTARGALAAVYQQQLRAVTQLANGADASTAKQVHDKARVVAQVLQDQVLEACYRECLQVAPDFEYPTRLIPKSAATLCAALWMHLARRHSYKRVGDEFYVPETDAQGRSYYRPVPVRALLTRVCAYNVAPNLCVRVLWNTRACEDVLRMLADDNEFPSLPVSKRYLGYANAVYDLEANEALAWDDVRADASVMPFHFIDQQLPEDVLELARATCPTIRVCDDHVEFGGSLPDDFVPTPLFDGVLRDQDFTAPMMMWLYALLGRLFHDASKSERGDNWEVVTFLLGAPGTGKSSVVALMQSYFQPSQVGIIPTTVEPLFPIASLLGKLLMVMTECGGCTLERDLFKQMASGDPVKLNTKYVTGVQMTHFALPGLFAGNSFMAFGDTDGSAERRCAVFPFTRVLGAGHGVTDLVARIVAAEGPQLLIKCNTLYVAMKRAIHAPIHALLPAEVRDATRQALDEKDSLRAFFAQQCVVTRLPADRVAWALMQATYRAWCRASGKAEQAADPFAVEVQALLRRLGVRLSRSHRAPVTLVGIRPRLAGDPPYRSVFEVRPVQRQEGAAQEEEESGSSAEQEPE